MRFSGSGAAAYRYRYVDVLDIPPESDIVYGFGFAIANAPRTPYAAEQVAEKQAFIDKYREQATKMRAMADAPRRGVGESGQP